MSKKIIIIFSVILCIAIGGYLFVRLNFLHARDFKPDTSKEKNIIDLRPSVIAKLQQVVKDGSRGLYKLSIGQIEPGVLSSTLEVVNAGIDIDTAVMKQLDSLKELPDDVFIVHFDSLHINGIGIAGLLNKEIKIKDINIGNPLIKVYHKLQPYNETKRLQKDTMSLYTRIKGQFKSISIGNITVDNGTFINTELQHKKTVNKFNNITVGIHDLLLDSATQFDANRFLFAKQANIQTKNYKLPTPDSLYYFKTGSISVSAGQHTIRLLNVELIPRGNREQFESRLKFRTNMYHIILPRVTLYNTDWQALMNHEKLIVKKAVIPKGTFSIYFDKTLPKPPIQYNNFPQQLLMKVAIPVSVNSLEMKNITVSFEEYNPAAKASGTAVFNFKEGYFTQVSNIKAEIKNHPLSALKVTGLFMNTPFNARFSFNLAKYKTGEFTAGIKMDSLNLPAINPMAAPLGLFSIKSGSMRQGKADITGNDSGTRATIAFSYTDLHIDPLKKANKSGKLKKEYFKSLFANTFLIKNENPSKGKELRQPVYSVERDHHENFFSLIWVSVLTGILKTIGVPVKFVVH